MALKQYEVVKLPSAWKSWCASLKKFSDTQIVLTEVTEPSKGLASGRVRCFSLRSSWARPPRIGRILKPLSWLLRTATRSRWTVFANATLRDAFERSNGLDRRLYEAGIVIFCGEWARARKARHSRSCLPDLASDIGDPDVCRGVDRWATNRLRALYPPFH